MTSKLSLESFLNVENLSLVLLPIINPAYLSEHKLRSLWTFATRLMRAMLDANLLDKQYVLESLVDLLEKSVSSGLVAASASGAAAGGPGAASGPSGSQLMSRTLNATVNAAPLPNTAGSFEFHSCKLILTTGKLKIFYIIKIYKVLQNQSNIIAYYLS